MCLLIVQHRSFVTVIHRSPITSHYLLLITLDHSHLFLVIIQYHTTSDYYKDLRRTVSIIDDEYKELLTAVIS